MNKNNTYRKMLIKYVPNTSTEGLCEFSVLKSIESYIIHKRVTTIIPFYNILFMSTIPI